MSIKKTGKTDKKAKKPWETQREVTGEQIRARKKTPCNLPAYDMKYVSLLHVCTIFSISYKRPGKHIKAQAFVVTFYFRWNTGLEKPDKCFCSWQLWSWIFIFTFFFLKYLTGYKLPRQTLWKRTKKHLSGVKQFRMEY